MPRSSVARRNSWLFVGLSLQGVPAGLYRQFPLLVCPTLDGGRLAMPRDHPYALVDPGSDVVRRAALQESDAVVAAGRQDTVARRLHFRRIRLGRNRSVAERKTQIARADLGKSQPRHRE